MGLRKNAGLTYHLKWWLPWYTVTPSSFGVTELMANVLIQTITVLSAFVYWRRKKAKYKKENVILTSCSANSRTDFSIFSLHQGVVAFEQSALIFICIWNCIHPHPRADGMLFITLSAAFVAASYISCFHYASRFVFTCKTDSFVIFTSLIQVWKSR